MELGDFNDKAKEEDQGALALVLDVAKAFERVSLFLQDALSEVTKVCPPLKFRVFVDDTTALLMEKNREVAEMAKKVTKKLKKR